jgi:hypothetical protein
MHANFRVPVFPCTVLVNFENFSDFSNLAPFLYHRQKKFSVEQPLLENP